MLLISPRTADGVGRAAGWRSHRTVVDMVVLEVRLDGADREAAVPVRQYKVYTAAGGEAPAPGQVLERGAVQARAAA